MKSDRRWTSKQTHRLHRKSRAGEISLRVRPLPHHFRSPGEIFSPAIAQAAPIKVGVFSPLSGVFSGSGMHLVNGIKMAFDEMDNKIAGRPVTFAIEDTRPSRRRGCARRRKLVESDQVDILLGCHQQCGGLCGKGICRARAESLACRCGRRGRDIQKEKLNPYAVPRQPERLAGKFANGHLVVRKGLQARALYGAGLRYGA